jgi:cytochrome c553
MTLTTVLFATLLLVALCDSWAFGQTTSQKNPPLVMSSMYGRDLFEFYCASCHGRDGKGSGPVAPALKTPPPHLCASGASGLWLGPRGGRAGGSDNRQSVNLPPV